MYCQLVEDAKLILNSLSNRKSNHVRRNINGAAHILPKLATKNVIDEIPNCICDIVQADQIASA
jgi:hypothetical protein